VNVHFPRMRGIIRYKSVLVNVEENVEENDIAKEDQDHLALSVIS